MTLNTANTADRVIHRFVCLSADELFLLWEVIHMWPEFGPQS